jgi:hypothetical protein
MVQLLLASHGPQKSEKRFLASGIWENSGNHFLWLLLFHKKGEQKHLTHSFEDITLLSTISVTSGFGGQLKSGCNWNSTPSVISSKL